MEEAKEKGGQTVEEKSREEVRKLTLDDCFAQRSELINKKTELEPEYVTAKKCSSEDTEKKGSVYSGIKKIAGKVAFYGLFIAAGAVSGYVGKSNEPEIKNRVQHQYTAIEQRVSDISTRIGNAASELGGPNAAVENAEQSKAYSALMQNLSQSIQKIEQQMSPEEFESFCTDVYAVFEKYNSSNVNVNDVAKVEGGGKENVQK